jgi:DNA-binding beta-propeller fold protein YncE
VAVPANSVAVLDEASGRVVAAVPVGEWPFDVVTSGGSAWVANAEDGTITRVDIRTPKVVGTIGLGFEPTGIAAAADAVWVVGGFEHALWRIDVTDGRVRLKLRFRERLGPLPVGYEDGTAGVAVGEGGVWVSHGLEVTLFDPRTGAVRKTVRAGGPWVAEIAAGEGSVWVAYSNRLDSPEAKRGSVSALDVVDPTAGVRRARIPLIARPSDVEVADGFAFAALNRADAVWRIEAHQAQLHGTMSVGDEPNALVVDGSMWVANKATATVTKLDDRSGATLAVLPVGHTLEGIAAADGELWVAVRKP